MRLDYITKVKSTTWNADVIIEHNTYKVAFNVYKCLHNVEATYKAMRKERVYRCWLLLPAVNSSYQEQKDHEIRELGEFRTKRLVLYLQLIIPQYFISNKSGIWSLSLIVHSKG